MKRILITGANSYIGMSFEKYLQQWPEEYHVDTVDMIDGTWRQGWHDYCETAREEYYGYIAPCCAPGETEFQHDLLGQLFNCEAHADMYLELFPSYNLTNEK